MKLLIVGLGEIWQRGAGAGTARFSRAGCTRCAPGVGGFFIASVVAQWVRIWPGSGAVRWSVGLARWLAHSLMARPGLQ